MARYNEGPLSGLNLPNLLVTGFRNGQRQQTKAIREIAGAYLFGILRSENFEAAHKEVAADARFAMKDSYNKTRSARKGPAPYRAGQGRLSGAMDRVLDRSDTVVGTATSVQIIPLNTFDEEAAHWRRLNFGARGTERSSRTPVLQPILFDNKQVLGNFGSRSTIREGFLVPERLGGGPGNVGYFTSNRQFHIGRKIRAGHQPNFFPKGTEQPAFMAGRRASGIEPWEFSTGAYTAVAKGTWPAYQKQFELARPDAEAAARAAGQRVRASQSKDRRAERMALNKRLRGQR